MINCDMWHVHIVFRTLAIVLFVPCAYLCCVACFFAIGVVVHIYSCHICRRVRCSLKLSFGVGLIAP